MRAPRMRRSRNVNLRRSTQRAEVGLVVAAGPEAGTSAARIAPMRMRCGWSPTGMRVTSLSVSYETTDTWSEPASDTKQ